MENTKVNDWLVATLSAPNNSFGDFLQEDVTPGNTTMLDKSAYQDTDMIKKTFSDDKGKFKQDEFDKFYDVALTTFNEFSKNQFDDSILNNTYYFKNDMYAPKNAKRYQDTTFLQKVKNPFRQKTGMEGFNIVSTPDLSVRELAQMTEARDSVTGESLGWKPNDDSHSGLFDFWKSPTLALAQYDEDGFHYDADAGRDIKHKKGDFKLNPDGDFFYETLGDREVYGKTMLNVWDTHTVDGSLANKWDFMDSDGLDKSLTGIIAKNVAKSIPYFLPGVGQVYAGVSIGLQLLDVLPALAKSTSGIFLGDSQKDTSFYKMMNKIQGLHRSISTDTSDYAKSGAFNTENIVGMVADVFEQLYQQKWIAAIPQKLAATSKEAALVKAGAAKYGPEFVKDIKHIAATEANLTKRAELIREKLFDDPQLLGIANNFDKWASHGAKGLSTAYMAATSAIGVIDEAKALGLDERDTAVLYLGTVAGFGVMMSTLEIGDWALQGLGLDDIGKMLNKSIKSESEVLRKSLQSVDDEILKGASKGLSNTTQAVAKEKRVNSIFQLGKNLGNRISKKVANVQDYGGAMLAEGLEETTEEAMQDAIKGIYNGMSMLGLVSTPDNEKKFSFDAHDMFSRYAMSAMGGAVGGAVFKLNENLFSDTFNQQDEETKKELIHIVRNGHAEDYLKKIDQWEKDGLLGDTNLSPEMYDAKYNLTGDVNYKPAQTSAQSQNAAVANLLRGQVKYLKNIIKQESMPSDYTIQKVYDARVKLAVDINQNTAIRDDVADLSGQIVNKIKEIREATPSEEGAEFDVNKSKSRMNQLNTELLDLKLKLDKIVTGEEYDKYYSEALFNMNSAIHSPFGIKNLEDFAESKYDKPFNQLDDTQKADIREEFAAYEQLDKRKQLRVGKAEFDRLNKDEINKIVPDLADYSVQSRGFVNYEATVDKYNVTEESVLGMTKDQVESMDLNVYFDVPGANVLEQLQSILNTQKYINPEIAQHTLDTIKKNKLNTLAEEGDIDLYRVFVDFMHNKGLYDLSGELDENSTNIFNDVAFDELNLLDPTNIDEVIDSIKDQIKTNKKKLVGYFSDDAFVDQLVSELDSFANDFIRVEYKPLLDITDNLINTIKGKEKNPLYEWIASYQLKTEQDEDASNLIKLLSDEFKVFKEKEDPTQYVIDNNVKVEQLEKAKTLLTKLQSVIEASTDFGYDLNHPSGFNSAINYVRQLNGNDDLLNILKPEHHYYINQDLAILRAKIEFLLNLSKLNADNRVKNLKIASGVMRALFLESVAPESQIFKQLESTGVDLTSVIDAFSNATQYKLSIDSIRSPEDNKIPFPSKDEDLQKLEAEGVIVEKAFYNLLQGAADKKDLYDKILATFSKKDIVKASREKTNFSHSTKTVSLYDSYLYLNQILNVDPIQFLNDFRGKESNGVFELEESDYAPFYGQEYVLKMSYWLLKSQSSDTDSFNKTLANISLPNVITEDNRADFADVIRTAIYNTIFIDGLPGSGKTTAVLNFIARIARNEGKTIAAFGPYKEQGENLQKSLGALDNIVNDNKEITPFLEQIIGADLYARINKALEDSDFEKIIVDRDQPDATWGKEKLLIREELKSDGDFNIRLNPKNEEIARFLNGDTVSILAVDGKNVDMLMVDEVTHLSPIDLDILSKAVEIHNSKNPNQKISMYFTGDTEQRGYTIKEDGDEFAFNIVNKYTIRTPTLSESLRAGYNVKSKNIDVIRAYRKTYDTILSEDRDVPVKLQEFIAKDAILLNYTEKDGELIGDKIVDEIKEEDVIKLLELSAAHPDKNGVVSKVAVITSDIESDTIKLIKNIPDWENRFIIKTPNQVQGLEFDYTIIDLKPTIVTPSNKYSLRRGLETLYTMISRSKKGSLIKGKIIEGINITSTDKNVYAVKTELNKDIVKSYKDFRLDSINRILNDITPSEFTKEAVTPAKTTVKPPSPLSEFEEKTMYEMMYEQTKAEPKTDRLDAIGPSPKAYEYKDENVLTYPFHQRFNLSVRGKDQIIEEVKGENSDLELIHNILFKDTVVGKSLTNDANVIEAKHALRSLKSAIYNYANYVKDRTVDGKNVLPLQRYLVEEMGVPTEIMEELNFSDVQISIESKTWDPEFDKDRSDTEYEKNEGGIIHYLVARVPYIHTDEVATDEQDPYEIDDKPLRESEAVITLAAFANRNNPNVAKLETVKNALIKLEKIHTERKEATGDESTYIDMSKDYEIQDLVKPTSNMILKRNRSYVDLPTFRKNNPHLVISKPYIIMPTDFERGDKEVNDFVANMVKPARLASGEVNMFSYQMIGRPVIFSSYDKTKRPSDLMTAYIDQFTESVHERSAIRDGLVPDPRKTTDTIKMTTLTPKGLKMSEWIDRNNDIYKQKLNPAEVDVDAQRRAYGNGYIAARMIANLDNFLQYSHIVFSKPEKGKDPYDRFRGVFKLDKTEYSNSDVDALISHVNEVTKTIYDLMLDMDYSYKNKDKGLTPQPPTAITENTRMKHFSELEASYGRVQAIKHIGTVSIYKRLKEKIGGENIEFISEGDKIFNQGFANSELFNMVAAIRVAFEGGSYRKGAVTVKKEPLFPSLTGEPTKGKVKLMKALDTIMEADFKEGIYVHPVLRKAEAGINTYDNSRIPFAVEVGNPDEHFRTDLLITEPNALFDLSKIEVRSKDEIVQEHKVVQEEYDKLMLGIELELDQVQNAAFLEHVPIFEFLDKKFKLSGQDMKVMKSRLKDKEGFVSEVLEAAYQRLLQDFKPNTLHSHSKFEGGNNIAAWSLVRSMTFTGTNIAVDFIDFDEAVDEYANAKAAEAKLGNFTIERGKYNARGEAIQFSLVDAETSEKIANFVFKDGEFKNFVLIKTGEQIAEAKATNLTEFEGLMNSLTVNEIVRPEFEEFKRMVMETFTANDLPDNIPERAILAKNAFMISASIRKNPKQFDAFTKWYNQFIDNYKC